MTRKFDITKIFIKVEYFFICVKEGLKYYLIILLVTNQSGINFDVIHQQLSIEIHQQLYTSMFHHFLE